MSDNPSRKRRAIESRRIAENATDELEYVRWRERKETERER